jgi:hypothetical protein
LKTSPKYNAYLLGEKLYKFFFPTSIISHFAILKP